MGRAPALAPVLVGDLQLDDSWPTYPLGDTSRYGSARLLVRLRGRPVGEVVVPLTGAVPTAEQLRQLVRTQLGETLPAVTRTTTKLPSATVVIATRDRPDSLLRCLDSLADSSHPSYDVVVVDSASTTYDLAKVLESAACRWPYPICAIRADRPGLGYAHQLAIGELTGEVAAFTDDDVEIDPCWLESITAPFVSDEVACVTGLILPAELETAAQQWIEDAGGFSRGFESRRYSLRRPPDDRLFPFTAGRFGSGANMAFRTRWLSEYGGFDPATGAGTPARGGDDLNAFLRVVLDGYTLVYEPAAIVRHHHRRDYAALRRQAYGYGVGLGAYLASAVRHEPRAAAHMLRRAVPAAKHLLAPGSVKNAGRGSDFPRELVWRERAGVCVGPLAYAFSRWRYREVIRAGVNW